MGYQNSIGGLFNLKGERDGVLTVKSDGKLMSVITQHYTYFWAWKLVAGIHRRSIWLLVLLLLIVMLKWPTPLILIGSIVLQMTMVILDYITRKTLYKEISLQTIHHCPFR